MALFGACGGGSSTASSVDSGATPATPVVSITSPRGGSSIAGTVPVAAAASSPGTLVGIQFELDGVALGSEVTSAPYEVSWITNSTSNGTHVLTAALRDGAGNHVTSPAVSVTVANTTNAAPSISGLHVVKNTVANDVGQAIVLHGVNRSGTEFACIQGWGIFVPAGADSASAVQAIKAWKGVNAVRVPMNEDCWLGINGAPSAYSGPAYRLAISTYVARLVQAGLIPILELHWTSPGTQQATGQQPMLNRDHSLAFWSQVANQFKGNLSVIFDLHNEPFPDSNRDSEEAWRCWRDGGTCSGMSFQAAGMQEVVNTIRAAGATNILLLGGVQYSNSLSQWLAHKPIDPASNLAASWHVYDTNVCSNQSCWDQAAAAVSVQVPLIAGEFGDTQCGTMMPTAFMNWMDSRSAGYLAWTWNHWGNCLDLVSDELAGAPTNWGSLYKSHISRF